MRHSIHVLVRRFYYLVVISHFLLCALRNSLLQPIGVKLSLEEAIDLVKDTFASAAERDIYTVRMRSLLPVWRRRGNC